jgi:hypothetical protein
MEQNWEKTKCKRGREKLPEEYCAAAGIRSMEGNADGSPAPALDVIRSAFLSATATASEPALVLAPIASKSACSI